MKNFALLSALSLMLLASLGAQAADTAELKVKGTIRPSACTPSFTGDGTVDYGTIAAKSLNTASGTQLPAKTIAFAVTCAAPTRIALRTIDNRASSVVTGLSSNNSPYGLGSYQSKNIGVYNVFVTPGTFTADGGAVDVIAEKNFAGSGNWEKSSNGNLGAVRHSFAAANAITPGAYQTVTGIFTIQATINKGSELPLTENIPLDGSATVEVQYL